MSSILSCLYVTGDAKTPSRGILCAGALRLPVALGRGGIVTAKTEGDGGTPRGALALRRLWYRADRVPAPQTGLALRAIAPDDLWCDAPADRNYNRPVRAPYPARHERMWRQDGLYDHVIELGWNDDPVVPGRGSAIFMHLARADYAPTEGCVALARADFARLLPQLGPQTVLEIR